MLTNHIHKFCISIQKTIKESAAYIPFNNSDDFSALQKCPEIKILNQQMKREILTRLSAWCLQYITVLLHRFSCGEHTYIPCSIEMYMLHKNCRHGSFLTCVAIGTRKQHEFKKEGKSRTLNYRQNEIFTPVVRRFS